MLYRIFLTIEIFFLTLYAFKYSFITEVTGGEVLGASTYNQEDATKDNLTTYPQIETTTAFEQDKVIEYESIPFEVKYVDDKDLEYGLEKVITPGKEGTLTYTYLVTHWQDEIIDRQLLNTERKDPSTQVVSLGKKIIWKDFQTPDLGKIKYWRKMRVWATKYDSGCPGCSNTTALGAPVQQGVCAVDPKVIAMYTHFYVPGYGKCQALDVGGAIKGNKIDLAFVKAAESSWGSQYVDIYLMDNEPTD
jgi:3D (Asp-Asp-Asp) domain-containing protein